MSSLGAKVKDILHSGDSQDTRREESDRRIPGSFPAEDMQSTEQQRDTTLGREHNKLHKPNDPRGWTEDDQTSRGYAYKDSGVGSEEARGQSAYNDSHRSTLEQPRDKTTGPYERTSEGTDPYERSSERTDPYERSSERTDPYERTSERTEPHGTTSERTPTERVDEPTTSDLPENKTNLTSQKEVLGSTVPTTQEHPYWGDLRPSDVQGSNDGHGSAVDEAKQYVEPTKTSPLVSGTFMKRRDPTDATDSSNTQQTTQHVADENKSDSHRKEEALGGAAVAGAGAYELNKKHRDDERRDQVDPATTSSTQPEEHKGRSFPLLGRGHKDKDVDHPKETKEDKHIQHPKEVKEDKHAMEPKPEHESKTGGGLFNRSHKDEDAPRTKEVKEDKHSKEPKPEHESKTGGGLFNRSHKDEDAPRTKEVKEDKHSKEPKPEHESKLGALFHRSHKDEDTTKPIKEDKHIKEPKPEHESKTGGGLFNRSHKDEDAPRTKEVKEDKHSKEPKPEHESKLGALFHRSHKDEDTTKPIKEDKHIKEPKPEHESKTGGGLFNRSHKDEDAPRTKEVKEDKHSKEPKPEHESKLGALFHRSHKDEDTTKHVKEDKHVKEPKPEHEKKTGGLFHRGHKEETVPDTQDNVVEDKHHGSKAAPALAAASAGGAATYLATRDHHDDHQPRDTTTANRYQDSTAPRGTEQYNTLSQPSEPKQYTSTTQHPTAGQYDSADATQHSGSHHIPAGAAVAGGAATYLATKDRHNDRQSQDVPTTGSQYHPADTTQHSGSQHVPTTVSHLPIASQFTSADRTQHSTGSQHTPAVTSQSSEPKQYTDTQHSRDNRHIPASAAGAAGLAGAGTYLATRDRHDDRQPRDTITTSSQFNPADTTQHSIDSQHLPTTGTQHPGTGQYNPVSQDFASQQSGTGHHSNLGPTSNFSTQSTQPTDRSFHDSTAQSYQPEASHSHRDAKLATGAAAGLGAGALASHEAENRSRNNQYTTEGTSLQSQPSQYQPGQPRTTGTTGFSDNTAAPAHGVAKNEPLSGSDDHSQGRSTDDLPIFTQNANKGKYNTLASGTPSGVRHD